MSDDNLQIEVMKALESDKYKWRTIKGISKEIGANEDDVLSVIGQNPETVVQSSVPSTTGEDLYTTKLHFNKQASVLDKIIGAFKGRIR